MQLASPPTTTILEFADPDEAEFVAILALQQSQRREGDAAKGRVSAPANGRNGFRSRGFDEARQGGACFSGRAVGVKGDW